MGNVKDAVKILTDAIKKDEGFRESYKANIAMAFKDEMDRNGIHSLNDEKQSILVTKELLHRIANNAADNFLDLWCELGRNKENVDFLPYNESLELKRLGFDERCYKEYHNGLLLNNSTDEESTNSESEELYSGDSVISAPLYQQVFRWFDEKFNVSVSFNDGLYSYKSRDHLTNSMFNTTEEFKSELSCIRSLINVLR